MRISFNFYYMCPLLLSSQHWLDKLGNSAQAFIMSFGGLGVLLLAMGDSSFISVPEANDVLIILLSAGASWGQMIYFVSMTIIGSVIGCMLLYSLGRKGGNPILRRKFSEQNVERAERLFKRYGILTVIISSILPPPTPFKVFVLSSGVFRLNPWPFFTAVVIGRTLRYSLWGILAVLYGTSVKLYVQQNLKPMGMMLFAGFALALIITFGFYLYRIKANKRSKAD
jgi:membrane protein DedA with SNARE-associated domain